MKNKALVFTVIILICIVGPCNVSIAKTSLGTIYEESIDMTYRNVTVYAPAVASNGNGHVGVISTITVTIQGNGSGRVFVDTLPLTEIDMQGSARLAVKVAGVLVKADGIDTNNYDFFFVVRTDAPIIGGPSAGGVMTIATIALLEKWDISSETVMTGMINPDGSIGPVGGIPQKIDAASSVGAKRFLIPKGQDTYTTYEKVKENGWSVTKPVQHSVTEYALEEYGIEVIEVEDANQAIMNFTGYGFPAPESVEKITTEDYIGSMKPLATTLLNKAERIYANASSVFSNLSVIDVYPYYRSQLNDIVDILNDGETRLRESHGWYDQGLYYSSTSKSFQSLIDSRFVLYATEYLSSDGGGEYIENLLENATSLWENKSEEAKNAEINGLVSLQCVGAAQKRVSEANSYLLEALDDYNKGGYLTALYEIAFAIERSDSIGWWLGISSDFDDTGWSNTTKLETLATEYIEDARQSITYSGVILSEVGQSSSGLLSAESLLESSQDNLDDGYPAAALFEALEALVKANLVIENIDDDAEGKINRSRESAGNSISKSRNMGIEPVLAVSYYEYAESLVNESAFDSALEYYKYSNIIAGALSFTNLTVGETSSRYVGIPEIDVESWRGMFSDLSDLILFAAVAIIIGVIGGLGIGIIIGANCNKRKVVEERGKKGKNWEPKNIDDYYKKQKERYFKDEEIPRSIKDYFDKNK